MTLPASPALRSRRSTGPFSARATHCATRGERTPCSTRRFSRPVSAATTCPSRSRSRRCRRGSGSSWRDIPPAQPLRGLPAPAGRAPRGRIPAAPGRATGLARLGLAGREPADVEGAILVTASLRPEDAPFLQRAAGVVSTGGGVLSHAGLLAMQFGKQRSSRAAAGWRRRANRPRSSVSGSRPTR